MVQFDSYALQLHRKELALTDDYATQLKSSIRGLESEVDSLERQISVFEAICRNLHRTLAASRTALALRRAVLAPIHRLPQELLVAMFQRCVTPDYDEPASLGDDVRWILLRVCRLWKCVLEGTPTMWTNLVVSPDTRSQALKLYLSFSSQHPLCVTVHEDVAKDEDLHFRDYWCLVFWEVLSSSTHRWRRLEINCFLTPVDDIIMHLMPLELPILEEVYVTTRTVKADPEGPSGQERSWFRHAPRLKRAMLHFMKELSYAWYPPSLTHMSSHIQGNGSVLEYALSFPNLQELVFTDEYYTMPLPSLRHNSLACLCASGSTLRYLTLPSLECLALDHYRDDSPTISWDDVTAFIHRSKCRLKGLRIMNSSILEEGLTHRELFALLAPTLVMLALTSYGTSDYSDIKQTIRSLIRTESSSGCLPHLKHLEISLGGHYREDHPDDVNSFVDTLTTALISLCDENLAKRWHAPLLMQVSVNSLIFPLVQKMRTSCLDSLFSRGLEVAYGRYCEPDWMSAWYYDTTRRCN